jgi:hypothetical protein
LPLDIITAASKVGLPLSRSRTFSAFVLKSLPALIFQVMNICLGLGSDALSQAGHLSGGFFLFLVDTKFESDGSLQQLYVVLGSQEFLKTFLEVLMMS